MLTTIERAYRLKAVNIFSTLSGEDLANVGLIALELHRGPGDEIIREGDVDDSLYVIVAGRVSVVKGTRTLAELGEGEVVGELALLDPAPRGATVRALTDVVFLRIDAGPLFQIMQERHEIARAVMRVLARRLRLAGSS
jgi:CRP/FNR family cyclic AMP-dependent transcriptional regulator